ncbi:MAG: stage II sporulation protein M [Planctomycetota bacterium]|nr:stage II sporulation protein M [Planctomycetota bacterium]
MSGGAEAESGPGTGRRDPGDVPAEPAERRDPAIRLRSTEFRKGREESWRRLDDLARRAEKGGVGSLSPDEARELPLLYQTAVSSLSVARTIVLDRNLLLYLENLTLRAYLVVYGPRRGMLESLAGFFARGFPRSVRRLRWHLAAAAAALLIGLAVGWAVVAANPSDFNLLVPAGLAGGRGPDSSAEELRRTELFAPWPGFSEAFIVFANSLFRHNTMVGILSFGLGFALGIPTLLLLGHNGMIIGAFIAIHAERGLTAEFLAWLSIHGVTEILAILLCGAGGLAVAEKIVFPGRLSRLDSLAGAGREAAGCAAGSVAMFFIAGILEGGFRQLVHGTFLRYAFGLASAALWLCYFGLAGKDAEAGDGE